MSDPIITTGYMLRSIADPELWTDGYALRATAVPTLAQSRTPCRSDRMLWITADGEHCPWPVGQPANVEGRGIPPISLDEQNILGDGASQGEPRFLAREIAVPFAVAGQAADVRRTVRDWATRLAADRREGTLLVQSVLNDERQIRCRYSGGLQLTELNNRWISEIVTFRAQDPFWEDTTDTVVSWAPGTEGVSFFPIPNPTTGSFVTISQGNVITEAIVMNLGDTEAWPVWEITGPGSGDIRLEHVGSGQTISFRRPLAPAETVTVDTRPGIKTVTAADGTNEFGSLGLSQLFSLNRGENHLRVTINGAEADTLVAMKFRRRWLTA